MKLLKMQQEGGTANKKHLHAYQTVFSLLFMYDVQENLHKYFAAFKQRLSIHLYLKITK